MALKMTTNMKGDTTDDILMALDEVRRLVAEGFLSGMNSNDTGEFHFQVEEKS